MKEKAAHLESLARMTRDNSSEGRQQLLHEITDMFMQQPDALSAREVAYFGEIMGGMVGGVETMVRQHLSETISSVSNAPQDLIISLANDEIEVALPVLTHSEVLDDDDLVRIVNEKGQEHMQAISKRETVSETVTDVLVKKGDDNVLGTLADNNGAQFSRGGMETMFDRAKDSDDLNKSLAAREDVPDDLAQDMFWGSRGTCANRFSPATRTSRRPKSMRSWKRRKSGSRIRKAKNPSVRLRSSLSAKKSWGSWMPVFCCR